MFGLTVLPLHLHEIASSFLSWTLLYNLSPFISARFSKTYPQLSEKTRLNWDVRIISFLHSVIISALCITIFISSLSEKSFPRLTSYSPLFGSVLSISIGYFLWDVYVCVRHSMGAGFIIHGVTCLVIYLITMKPLNMYWGIIFLLFELSTPFINIHWFMDKLNMTGTKWQFVNGICCLFVFFSARLVFGTTMSGKYIMQLIDEFHTINPVHGILCIAANCILNSLNFYWFSLMIFALRKRFK